MITRSAGLLAQAAVAGLCLFSAVKAEDDMTMCESNPKCKEVGLVGSCCPTADDINLACCRVVNPTPPSPTPTPPPGIDDRSCKSKAHPQCNNLAGDCCPTELNAELECCHHHHHHNATSAAPINCESLAGCSTKALTVQCCPPAKGLMPKCCQAATSCKVLAGTFAKLMQGTLFAISMAVLASKFFVLEKNKPPESRRTAKEFCLDSSKQLWGAGFIHVANMVAAIVFSKGHNLDQCTAYWLNIVLDTTLGVFIEFQLLKLSGKLIGCLKLNEADFKSGEYNVDGVFQPQRFIKQLAVWSLIVTLMKVCIVGIINNFSFIGFAASSTLSPLNPYPDEKLLMVMIFTPCCMNAFQFFMTDVFLAKHGDAVDESLLKNEYDQGENPKRSTARQDSRPATPYDSVVQKTSEGHQRPANPYMAKQQSPAQKKEKDPPYTAYRGPRENQ